MLDSAKQTDIEHIVSELKPQSILLIGADAATGLSAYLATLRDCNITLINSTDDVMPAVKAAGQHDLSIWLEPLSTHNKRDASNTLSALRDVYSHYVLLLTTLDSQHWQHADLIAYGLSELRRYDDGHYLFEYNILTYKQTPDWLNPKHWANPERWNKDRW